MTEKKVDEGWKEKAATEKETPQTPVDEEIEQPQQQQQMPPVDFSLFISSLGMQALLSLGEIENPMTNKKEQDLIQAKYLIDTMEMIQGKTTGNLTDDEQKMLDQILYELRMKFVSISK